MVNLQLQIQIHYTLWNSIEISGNLLRTILLIKRNPHSSPGIVQVQMHMRDHVTEHSLKIIYRWKVRKAGIKPTSDGLGRARFRALWAKWPHWMASWGGRARPLPTLGNRDTLIPTPPKLPGSEHCTNCLPLLTQDSEKSLQPTPSKMESGRSSTQPETSESHCLAKGQNALPCF